MKKLWTGLGAIKARSSAGCGVGAMRLALKEFYRKEKYIALHAQSRRFRIVKYCVLLAVAVGVYVWKGLAATVFLFLLLFLAGICLHFFFRWKTEAWTKSWGLYKRIPFEGE